MNRIQALAGNTAELNDHSKVFELGPTERFLHASDGWHRPK